MNGVEIDYTPFSFTSVNDKNLNVEPQPFLFNNIGL